MRGERGYSLPELLVVISIGSIVLFGIFTLIQVTARSSAQTVSRVDANQRARPVLERLMDELHSTCLVRGAVPVIAGSTDSELRFIHQTGSAVSPTPDQRVVTLVDETLSESAYPLSGGSTPADWAFATTPNETRQLLTKVGPATVGAPAVAVPLFQYFAYNGGAVSSMRLPTPLSTADAARAVQVTVSFSSSPLRTEVIDANAPVGVSSSAVLRFSPPSEDPTKVNGPCA